MTSNASPWTYTLCSCAASWLAYRAYEMWLLGPQWFPLPVFILALLYGATHFIRQQRYAGVFHTQFSVPPLTLLKKTLARYVVWLGVLVATISLYRVLPFYSTPHFAPVRAFLELLLWLYVIGGLPYFVLTLLCKASRTEDFYDPAVRIIHVFKQTVSRIARGGSWRALARVVGRRYHRKIALNFVMRGYFLRCETRRARSARSSSPA